MSAEPRDADAPAPRPAEIPKAVRRRAAEWLALREARGFTTTEYADFADWLRADVRHRAAFAEIAAGWARLDGLAAHPHSADAAPDPDLLRPSKTERRWAMPVALAAAAAAAVIVLSGMLWLKPWAKGPGVGMGATSIAQVAPRVLQLSDGSSVELNAASEVSEQFTAEERRVRLVRGEAHFTVTKNPARPFIVDAGGVKLRAVGTAFNVRLASAEVEVLVTHGRVQVTPPVREAAA
ncbi:MAG: FecR domain-containing protein, partial [Verrucomicrobiota bacterium]